MTLPSQGMDQGVCCVCGNPLALEGLRDSRQRKAACICSGCVRMDPGKLAALLNPDLSGEGIASEPRSGESRANGSQIPTDAPSPDKALDELSRLGQELQPEHYRPTPRLAVRCPECDGWDATHVSCPHRCGVTLYACTESNRSEGTS